MAESPVHKAVLQPMQSAEVSGVVTSVQPYQPGKPTQFRINCPNIKQNFDVVCELFCPVREKDTIYALCMMGHDGKLHVQKPPFVQPAMDKDSILQCIMRCLRCGFGPAVKTFQVFSQRAQGDDNVIPFLSGLAQSWNDTHNPEIIFLLEPIDSDDVKKLLAWWHKERNIRRLYLFGLSKKEINACRMTCDAIYQACMTNPYTVPAIPMEKCDAILDRLNKRPTVEQRTCGQIIRVMWRNLNEAGWTGNPTRNLAKQFPNLSQHAEMLKNEYGVVAEMETAYLKFPHTVETFIADYITNMVKTDPVQYDTPLDQAITLPDGRVIERISVHLTMSASEDQRHAVQGAMDHNLCVITGGPGCGKTTVLGQIIHNLEMRGVPYVTCSFTGKAVARIREVTKKRNPSTIHRLIANSRKDKMDKRSNSFEKEMDVADYEHIIIDEISMVTTELLYELLRAYPKIKRLTLIGDDNQLPPISWGSLFSQIMKSKTVPTYRLTTNFRVYTQDGERDGVILNANALIAHESEFPFEYVATTNFSLIEGPVERVHDIIKACYRANLKAHQVVVLCPYNKDLPGLNRAFQEIYNEGARSVTDSRGIRWMVGDRVMLTENDADIGVYNGESGTIRDITDKALLVDFGYSGVHEFLLEPTREGRNYYQQAASGNGYHQGRRTDEVMDGDEGEYDDERTVKRITHSYAITVDKSQGSEYDFVILYISEFNTGSFLNKNRIYTAITRTKRCCWVCTPDTSALEATSVKSLPYRCDNLGRRLRVTLPEMKPFQLTPLVPGLEMNNDTIMTAEEAAEMDFGFDGEDF